MKTRRIIKDQRMLEPLNQIFCIPRTARKKRIPIGNLTSQYFANYLSFFDHFVKEELKVKRYIRYMDDCLSGVRTRQK